MNTPATAIDAIIDPAPLTLGQVALLDKIGSPILNGSADDMVQTLKSIYALSLPLRDAVRSVPVLEEEAIVWAETITIDEYRERIRRALESVRRFYEMLPPAEANESKKKSATDSSPS